MLDDPRTAALFGEWLSPATTILAALIGGAFALLAARVSCRKQVREAVEEERGRFEAKAAESAELQRKLLIEEYGFRIRRAVSRLEVFASGDAKLTRSWEGVHVEKGFQIPHIPGQLRVSTPGGEIHDVTLNHQFASRCDKVVRFVRMDASPGELAYRVEVSPALAAEDPDLEFSVTAKLPKAVLMTEPEAARAYSGGAFPRDYLALEVVYPTDDIEVAVRFPEASGFDPYPVVFYLQSELEHARETISLTKSGGPNQPAPFVRAGADEAVLRVSKPKTAFRYAIAWIAPTTAPRPTTRRLEKT